MNYYWKVGSGFYPFLVWVQIFQVWVQIWSIQIPHLSGVGFYQWGPGPDFIIFSSGLGPDFIQFVSDKWFIFSLGPDFIKQGWVQVGVLVRIKILSTPLLWGIYFESLLYNIWYS